MSSPEISKYVETFSGPWPDVLVEMKEFVDLSFLAAGSQRRSANIRILIARQLAPQAHLQPHIARFRQALSRMPSCHIELNSTDEGAHKIEIEYRR
jgi:hypothetical protein